MSNRNFHLHNGQKGAALAVRVTPRATSNQVAEILHDGTIRLRLVAAPGDEVNAVLTSYLADILEVPESAIDVVAGQTGRDKLVSVLNLDSEDAHRKILSCRSCTQDINAGLGNINRCRSKVGKIRYLVIGI